MADEGNFAQTITEAAQAIGVHERTLKQYLSEGAPGKTSQGYDIDAIIEWRDLNRSKPQAIEPDDFKIRMAVAKLREQEGKALKVESEARIKQHEAKRTTEDVVHMDDVMRFLSMFFTETSRVLLRIPKEMRSGYPEALQQALEDDLEARLSIALRTVSGYCRRVVDIREES